MKDELRVLILEDNSVGESNFHPKKNELRFGASVKANRSRPSNNDHILEQRHGLR